MIPALLPAIASFLGLHLYSNHISCRCCEYHSELIVITLTRLYRPRRLVAVSSSSRSSSFPLAHPDTCFWLTSATVGCTCKCSLVCRIFETARRWCCFKSSYWTWSFLSVRGSRSRHLLEHDQEVRHRLANVIKQDRHSRESYSHTQETHAISLKVFYNPTR